ncbi:SpvB/TcaC N-terminal domain-containing protein [Pseudomonas sp. P2757]|uniref:SpvB/TcaC N-terminal domain-containing protein n=1 Tax=unclassified Pseudomonas TaxID=196821 RepID=UPI003B5B8735
MSLDADALITPPSIAKSASTTTGGRSWGEIGVTGGRSYAIPVPFLDARSLKPALDLVYDGSSGNGKCGLSWQINPGAIIRKTSKGVPQYLADDVMQAGGTDLHPEVTTRGKIKSTRRTRGKGRQARKFSIVNYIPRQETSFDRYELWTPDVGKPFWIVYGADGTRYCYGYNDDACIYDPKEPTHIAEWLLTEIRNPLGENVFYQYKRDDQVADRHFDYQAQRYLQQVCYCNKTASTDLYCFDHAQPQLLDWLFRLIVDYGERAGGLTDIPAYAADEFAWTVRSDPFRMYRYGFELATRRLCKQFLLFNNVGTAKVLVNRLLLEHEETPQQYSQLKAAHSMSYDATGLVKHTPPIELFYQDAALDTQPQPFLQLDNMPGLNDGQPYHCVDLKGEGLPGFLCQYDGAWYYREPLRGTPGTDEVIYGPWALLPLIPNADSSQPVVQVLTDLTGDGRLDWIVAQPGLSGYYTLNPDGSWSLFKPFAQFPVEFFHHLAQLGDLIGDGLQSVAMVGPNSVRVYANLREQGFAAGKNQPHGPDRLPLFSDARNELVMFSGLGASGTELCRIRHDEIRCWPSLGHGRFETGFKLSDLPFGYEEFDAERVRVADIDGSGAPAFIYLSSDYFEIWLNHGGNRLAPTPIRVAWPAGVRYDNLCQVTFADLRGLGCASLLLTVPHMKPQHWVYHFVSNRPYMLIGSNNNMGYNARLQYRSSAQYWLDEKRQELVARRHPVCYLPFSQMVLEWLRQEDEITGNYLMQSFEYFQGYYDGLEREFRGFARVYQTDSELEPGKAASGHTAPMRVKNWFHVGQFVDQDLKDTCDLDNEISPLGPTVITAFDAKRGAERIHKRAVADEAEIANALAGRALRSEVTQADDPAPARLFSLTEHRYRVRQVVDTPSSLLVLEQETRSHQYERFMDDPSCRHVVNLGWDQFGMPEHSITVDCPRRRSAKDPFEEEDQKQAWADSFDPQQEVFYLTETLADFIHQTDPTRWHLGLPSRQRGNAWIMPEGLLPGGLTPDQISCEQFAAHHASPEWTALRELTALSRQTYLKAPDGTQLYPPQPGPTERAVFDEKALAAYGSVKPPIVIREELRAIGYQPMKLFFPEDPLQDPLENLWSAQSGFFTFADAAGFFQPLTAQPTASHGVTEITRDANHLHTIAITQPDGCVTNITYDPHTLLPVRIRDPNENIQEARYDAGGQPTVLSFYGTEQGVPAGFDPLTLYPPQTDLSVAYAIANPERVVASAASAVRTELFSWMASLPPAALRLKRKQWIAKGWILPSGHVRAAALRDLSKLKKRTASEQTLLKLIHTAARQPVHSAVLMADRYPYDPQKLIQIVVRYIDGFGRELQSKQLVPAGDAYVSTADGNLEVGPDGTLIEAAADPRWRVSGRVEYNHKGETIRVYRAYYLNTWRYISDSAMREHGYHDQLFYDALGRPIKTINALGHLAYDILHPWFTCSYDFNDTDDTIAPAPARPARTGTSAKQPKKAMP